MDFNQFNYSNFVNSGANTNIKNFMESAIDTMKNAVLSGTNNEITIDQAGLRCRKYDEASGGFSPKQVWIAYNAIMFTNDNWNSATIGIGEFVDKNLGSLYGIVAPAIVGTILAGSQLVIESEKQDGGIAVFKMDAEGASLHNASFNLYGSTGGRIDLGSTFGIVGGSDKNTLFVYDSNGQPTGVKTKENRSIARINDLASTDTPNANFWIDMYGDVYLKGTIDAIGGIFRGSLEVGGPTAFRVDSQGNLSIGGTANNPNFYVDANGNMKAKSGEFKGRVDASSLYVGGRNILTNTSGSNNLATDSSKIGSNFLELKGLKITNNQGQTTFEVNSSGNVSINGNITFTNNGAISWNSLGTDVQNTINKAQDTANNALNSIPELPSYIQSTKITQTTIESPNIYGGTIYAGVGKQEVIKLNDKGISICDGSGFNIVDIKSGSNSSSSIKYAVINTGVRDLKFTCNTVDFSGCGSVTGLKNTAVFG